MTSRWQSGILRSAGQTDKQANRVTAPWPAGLTQAARAIPAAGGVPEKPLAYVKSAELLTLSEVRLAAAYLLDRHQRRQMVAWRDAAWFGEEDACRAIRISRTAVVPYSPRRRELHRNETGPVVPIGDAALDALAHTFTLAPKRLITSLSRLGVQAKTADDADYYVAFTLLDHADGDAGWFDLVRLAGIKVADIPTLRASLGAERLDLLLRLGWDSAAINQAVRDLASNPDHLDLNTLRVLAALHTGRPVTAQS